MQEQAALAALQAEAARLEEEKNKEAEKETNPESANPVGASNSRLDNLVSSGLELFDVGINHQYIP